jgi:hypothetical protein
MNESISMAEGVAIGVGRAEQGVFGEVADGIMYESKTSMRSRVMVAMTGWRRELALMVLNLNLRLSGTVADGLVEIDWVRVTVGLVIQRAFNTRPWSSV